MPIRRGVVNGKEYEVEVHNYLADGTEFLPEEFVIERNESSELAYRLIEQFRARLIRGYYGEVEVVDGKLVVKKPPNNSA